LVADIGLADAMPGPSADPIREAIDAQSGRFEYFKYALILGSAGIAGLAAILTDETKIPDTLLRKSLVGASGVIFFLLIVTAVFGFSVYANLLTRIEDEKGQAPPAGARGTSATAKRSMITYTRVILGVLLVGGATLLTYAFVLLAGPRAGAPVAEKPNDAALLALIADARRTADDAKRAADDAKKTADDAAAAASRNSTALAAFTSDVQARFSATEALIRKAADDGQARFDAIDRRFAALEQMVGNIKPPPPPMPLSLEQAKDIQRALQMRGFRPGKIDGVFGPRSGAAIRAYQSQRSDHPAVTGILTHEQVRDLLP
jgi:hypothetical protein